MREHFADGFETQVSVEQQQAELVQSLRARLYQRWRDQMAGVSLIAIAARLGG